MCHTINQLGWENVEYTTGMGGTELNYSFSLWRHDPETQTNYFQWTNFSTVIILAKMHKLLWFGK